MRADGTRSRRTSQQAEADALLALRRPAEARTAYEAVLATDPRLRSARVGLFFALLEDEQVSAALALADAMAAEGGPKTWRQARRRSRRRNWDSLDGQTLAATARYYAGANREAWRRLQPLVNGAPGPVVPAFGGRPQIASASGCAAARRRGDAHRRLVDSPGSIHPRSRSPRPRSCADATTRPGSAPPRLGRSSPPTRPWSGCGAAVRRRRRAGTALRLAVPHRAGGRARQSRLGIRRPIGAAGAAHRRTLAPEGGVPISHRLRPSRVSFGGPVTGRRRGRLAGRVDRARRS